MTRLPESRLAPASPCRALRRRRARARRAARSARGFSLIELLIVVAIIGIIAAVAIPNLLAARRVANEASAISTVRTLSSAEEAYRASYGGGSRFTDLNGLAGKLIIDATLAAATTVDRSKNGYVFNVVTSDNDRAFCAGAAPATAYRGTLNYSSDTPGVLYVHPLAVGAPPVTTAGGTPLNR